MLLVGDATGLGVLLLVLAGVLAVVLVREVLRARTVRRERGTARELVRRRVEEGRASAARAEAAARETRAEVAGLARAITGQPAPAASEPAAATLR